MRYCQQCAERLNWPFDRGGGRCRDMCEVCGLSFVVCGNTPIGKLPVPLLGESPPDEKMALHEVFARCKSELSKAWTHLLHAVGDHAALVARSEAIKKEGHQVADPVYEENQIATLEAAAKRARANWCERFIALQKVAVWVYGYESN